mgnify:CR=1 FL=1
MVIMAQKTITIMREDEPGEHASLIAAISADSGLTARQRRALTEIYTAMTEATAARRSSARRVGCRARVHNGAAFRYQSIDRPGGTAGRTARLAKPPPTGGPPD